jgi:hypothetical protein
MDRHERARRDDARQSLRLTRGTLLLRRHIPVTPAARQCILALSGACHDGA